VTSVVIGNSTGDRAVFDVPHDEVTCPHLELETEVRILPVEKDRLRQAMDEDAVVTDDIDDFFLERGYLVLRAF